MSTTPPPPRRSASEEEVDRIRRDYFPDDPLPGWIETTLNALLLVRDQRVVFGQSVAQIRTAIAFERAIDRLVAANNSGTEIMSRLTRAYVGLTAVIAIATLVAAGATGVQVWGAVQQGAIERRARWVELHSTISDYFDLHSPGGLLFGDIDRLKIVTEGDRIIYFRTVRRILGSQSGNPVLLDDDLAIGRWRNAISSARTAEHVIQAGADDNGDRAVLHARSILEDVTAVWESLVLKSGEVSATGGRPSPTP